MGLLRWALIGAIGYSFYRFSGRGNSPDGRRELDGLCAVFATRESADLAVEHLVQEYGIDRAFIYVEPLADENSSGIRASGGDHASGAPSHRDRADAPLNGTIQVTMSIAKEQRRRIEDALKDAGAIEVEVF